MDNDNNTDVTEETRQAFDSYRQTAALYKDLENTMQQQLQALKTKAGSTFDMDDKHFQIRQRQGRLYFCELTNAPKGRPKGPSRKRLLKEAENDNIKVLPAAENKDQHTKTQSTDTPISAPLTSPDSATACAALIPQDESPALPTTTP